MRWRRWHSLPAPLNALPYGVSVAGAGHGNIPFHLADVRLTPHYPAKSPLDDVLRLLVPGSDEFVTEKYAFEIGLTLREWGVALRNGLQANAAGKFLDPAIKGARLNPAKDLSFARDLDWKCCAGDFQKTLSRAASDFSQKLKTISQASDRGDSGT